MQYAYTLLKDLLVLYFYALKNNKIRTPAWRDLHVLYDYCNNHTGISNKLSLEVTLNFYTYKNAFYKYGK